MKKMILAFTLLLGINNVLFAQSQKITPGALAAKKTPITPEKAAEIQTLKMQQALNLDGEQKQKVNDVNRQICHKMTEAKGNNNTASSEKINMIQKEKEKMLQPILTPEQFEKYKQMKDELNSTEEKKVTNTSKVPEMKKGK
jgi:hypothetical protein